MGTIVEKKQKQQTETNAPILLEKDENVEWSTDVSEEAIKKRREEEGLSERIKNLTIALDSDDEVDVSPVEILKEYINKRPNCTEMQLLKAALKIKKDYEMKDSDVACLLFESCFDDKNIMNNLKKRGKVLHRFIKTTAAQKTILGYLEALLGKEEELLEKASVILEYFYWNEMLDEEVLLKWFSDKKGKFLKDPTQLEKVKAGSKPFITWLQTAQIEE